MKYDLLPNPGYESLTPAGKESFCNGCGARGMLDVIPDTMPGGCVISEACNRHDYGYATAEWSQHGKDREDVTFLANMLITILNCDDQEMIHQAEQAVLYFKAVRTRLGDKAFWNGKDYETSG